MKQSRFTVEQLSLPGVLSVNPLVFLDERGFSATTYSIEELAELGIHSNFVEGYTSRSHKNVIRGLHFQRPPYAQDKLVRCSEGEIFAVVADYEETSLTYGQYVSITLNSETQSMLFVPGQYALGFCVTSDDGALIEYRLGDTFHPEVAGGVAYNDPLFGIPWPTANPILATKDKDWQLLPHHE